MFVEIRTWYQYAPLFKDLDLPTGNTVLVFAKKLTMGCHSSDKRQHQVIDEKAYQDRGHERKVAERTVCSCRWHQVLCPWPVSPCHSRVLCTWLARSRPLSVTVDRWSVNKTTSHTCYVHHNSPHHSDLSLMISSLLHKTSSLQKTSTVY